MRIGLMQYTLSPFPDPRWKFGGIIGRSYRWPRGAYAVRIWSGRGWKYQINQEAYHPKVTRT